MNKQELQDFLINEAEYDEEDVMQMSAYELFDKFIRYEGLIGWTDMLIETFKELKDEL